jgi:parallel beta-helix repeat protein
MKLAIIFCSFVIFMKITFAQVNKVYSEAPIISNNGTIESTQLTVKFRNRIFDLSRAKTESNLDSILPGNEEIKIFLNNLQIKYGSLTFRKIIPEAIWGDTLYYDTATGVTKRLPDLSQIYSIRFARFVTIDSIINALKNLKEVVYAERPIQAINYNDPNDLCYNNEGNCISGLVGDQWNLFKVDAQQAWNITTGSPAIKIAEIDLPETEGSGPQKNHPDFINLDESSQFVTGSDLSIGYGSHHATGVCGVIGAATNNGAGIASLGWNIKMLPFYFNDYLDNNTDLPDTINVAISKGAKIINCSFGMLQLVSKNGGCTVYRSYDYSVVRDVISSALRRGIIVIAATGDRGFELTNGGCSNTIVASLIPYTPYPAAYSGVIGVAATDENDVHPIIDGLTYNYDDIDDGAPQFITVAAPGIDILTLNIINSYQEVDGTSFSAPLVSALTGLILSVNSSLSPQTVQNILENSSDKVDNINHPYNSNGWNAYEGYGRINAYNALKYTLEHYGGTLTQNIIIPSGETWTFSPGVTLTFQNGSTLTVNGTLNAQGTSTNHITFNFGSPNSSTQNGIIFNAGSGGSLTYCNIKNAYRGVYCNTHLPNIENCSITYNMYGIYLYNVSSTSNQIYHNTIASNTTSGIFVYNL